VGKGFHLPLLSRGGRLSEQREGEGGVVGKLESY